MAAAARMTLEESHRKFAADFFNEVWPLLGKAGRTPDDDERMINDAHASLLHWQHVGGPENVQRGEWMVSHVYAVVGMGQPALYHARICMRLTDQHGLGGFDLAYAYEGMARAHAASGDRADAVKFRWMAREAAQRIAKAEERRLFLDDLAAGPWYGVV